MKHILAGYLGMKLKRITPLYTLVYNKPIAILQYQSSRKCRHVPHDVDCLLGLERAADCLETRAAKKLPEKYNSDKYQNMCQIPANIAAKLCVHRSYYITELQPRVIQVSVPISYRATLPSTSLIHRCRPLNILDSFWVFVVTSERLVLPQTTQN